MTKVTKYKQDYKILCTFRFLFIRDPFTMHLLMSYNMILSSETFTTIITWKRLHVTVYQLVPVKSVSPLKPLSTFEASVHVIPVVIPEKNETYFFVKSRLFRFLDVNGTRHQASTTLSITLTLSLRQCYWT